MKLPGLVLNFNIDVSVSNFYIFPRLVFGKPICSQIHKCGNKETEHYNPVLEITKFHFWKYINLNQTLYWILTGPSFAVQGVFSLCRLSN
jgi:hypothetical protein